jgi:regulator of protease activity HflC (stomatin/prohibitin superfamily)
MSLPGEVAAPKAEEMDEHGARGRRDCGMDEVLDRHGEDTPAYDALRQHGLLETRYRLETSHQIDSVSSNATRGGNLLAQICCCPCYVTKCFKTFEVDAGKVQLVENGRGGYYFYGAGVHRICDPFYKVGAAVTYAQGAIQHGDLGLVVVEQGRVGYVSEKGQPVMLPPGMHMWRSTTMVFEKAYDLNNNVVHLGPNTLVTVDAGYSAVTEDNGRQKILKGGATYLLTHRNWKFQKFISQKIQSDMMKRIEATSADNVLMAVDATLIWRITNVEAAALNAGETIAKDGSDTRAGDIGSIAKLRNDVLKQAEASLAAFIGAVNYSDSFNVAAAVQKSDSLAPSSDGVIVVGRPAAGGTVCSPVQEDMKSGPTSSPLFDIGRMQTCLDHSNAVTSTYGVTILSINVVAAVPADKSLMVSLAQGAVAAAEAQKFEVVANGKAAAAKIEARGQAEAMIIRARGDSEGAAVRAKGEAEAERTRADGQKSAAELLASSDVAVDLATIDRTGQALHGNTAYFFGADARDVGSLLIKPAIASRDVH